MIRFWILDFGFAIRKYEREGALFVAVCALLVALCTGAEAQQRAREHARIGFLWASALRSDASINTALRELGYIEGRNITIEYRYAQGKLDRYRLSLPIWSAWTYETQ